MSIADKILRAKEDYDRVFEAGKNAGGGSDAFWDAYQDYGKRTSYEGAFYGGGWTPQTFKPKYDITPIGSGTFMFYMMGGSKGVIDLAATLESLGVELNTAGVTNSYQMFSNTSISRIPQLNLQNVPTFERAFRGSAQLQQIDEILLRNDGSQTFPGTFELCPALREITFSGTIGQDLNMAVCPLSRVSIESVVDALSTTSSGKTLTLNATAVNDAFTSAEWSALKATRSNWVFNV